MDACSPYRCSWVLWMARLATFVENVGLGLNLLKNQVKTLARELVNWLSDCCQRFLRQRDWEDEEYEMPATTALVHLRRWPRCSSLLFFVGFALLLMGKQAVTILWLLQFSLHDVAMGAAISLLFFLVTLFWLTPAQAVASIVALMLAVLPALSVYSGLALFVMPHWHRGWCEVWQIPLFAMLSVIYTADSLPAVLQAEYGDGPSLKRVTSVFARVSWIFRTSYVCALVLYGGVALVMGSTHPCTWTSQQPSCSDSGSVVDHSLVLGLYALSFVSADVYTLIQETFATDIWRLLLGAGEAFTGTLVVGASVAAPSQRTLMTMALTCQKSIQELRLGASTEGRLESLCKLKDKVLTVWSLLGMVLPKLRDAAPPEALVAVFVVLRQVAPMLAPLVFVLTQLYLPLYAIIFFVAVVAPHLMRHYNEHKKHLPPSKLQRLTLLIPNFYIDPSVRTKLGCSLSIAKHVQRSTQPGVGLLRMGWDGCKYSSWRLLRSFG